MSFMNKTDRSRVYGDNNHDCDEMMVVIIMRARRWDDSNEIKQRFGNDMIQRQ